MMPIYSPGIFIMRFSATFGLLALLITPALAQTPLADATGVPTTAPAPASDGVPAHARAHATLQQRFDKANTTHDGHLTLEQARSKMPAVARDFDSMDNGHNGYVTVDEIKNYNRARRAARVLPVHTVQ